MGCRCRSWRRPDRRRLGCGYWSTIGGTSGSSRQRANSSSNQVSGTRPSNGIVANCATRTPVPARTWAMQAVRSLFDPPQARPPAASIGERPAHQHRSDDRAKIGERARQPGAPDAVDGDDVRRLERSHMMGDDFVVRAPAVAAGDADLHHLALDETVETMKTGGRPMRRDGVATTGEGGGHEAPAPTVAAAGHDEHAGVRLVEPAEPDRGGDTAAVEVQFGSLATGERTMLRGCELGNGAYCVVRHASDDTDGVSERVRRQARAAPPSTVSTLPVVKLLASPAK